MIDFAKEQAEKIRALLVGAPKADISELKGLTDTLGYEIVRTYILLRLEENPVYGLGKGKASEIAALATELTSLFLILSFPHANSATGKNWQKFP